MNWNSWQEFLAMGDYGFYVWGSYGVTLILIIAELAMLAARGKALARWTARRRTD